MMELIAMMDYDVHREFRDHFFVTAESPVSGTLLIARQSVRFVDRDI
jgi:hypothetical protein